MAPTADGGSHARKVAPDRVISTVDSDTRHAHKSRERRQDGYKAHVVVEPDTGLITNTELPQASGPANSDAAVGIRLLDADPTLPSDTPLEALGDSAYGTGDALAALDNAGHTPVMKPWPLRPAVAGGFSVDDFTLTDDGSPGRALIRPNGVTRPITAAGNVVFGRLCRDCPLQERCTTAKDGRTLHPGPHNARPPASAPGPRRHRRPPRGLSGPLADGRTIQNNAWLHVCVAAINLRRLLILGLHHHHASW